MTEITYELIPDTCKVYPVYDDDFSTLEHAEVNSEAWDAHISTAGGIIKSVIDPDGVEYTAIEQLKDAGIISFKLVCEYEVEL